MLRPPVACDPVPSNVSVWPHAAGFGVAVKAAVGGAAAALMVCDRDEEVLGAKLPSPSYTAVIACGLPAAESAAVEKIACPAVLTVAVPSVVAPSLKVTVPVRVPAAGGVALARSGDVTDLAAVDGVVWPAAA